MRFLKFEIDNFKGIRSAQVDLLPAGSNVFTLIGLNESGKTTVLEAIDDFGSSPEGLEALYGAERSAEFASYVPKHLKANFSGDIIVTALIEFGEGEREQVIDAVRKTTGFSIDPSSVPSVIRVTRGYSFENSDYKKKIHKWNVKLAGKGRGDRKQKALVLTDEIGKVFVAEVSKRIPKIVYFPTFLFSIPERIFLNPDESNESDVNRHYRQIIQDVASSLSSPLDVKTHIVDRILNEKTLAQQFIALWFLEPDKQQQINATLNALSAHLTKTVFESWGKIFSGDFKGREIVVRLGIDNEGSKKLVYLKFVLKDGTTEYDVSERSLGFRWFFSFLLFTLYRVYSKGRGATLFLLDEPASNLHARAQMQLLNSFARIADGDNGIMYSTHSHYMVNPEWLDQSFVVANTAIDYDDELSENRPTEVEVQRYRAFVGANPDKTTYFQPVLDKLDVVPSRLDILRPSLLVEGKGDYFILEYGRRVLLGSESPVAIVPTRGTAGMDELIGLFLGWGVEFAVCLDADKAGKDACQRYRSEWAASARQVFTLEDLHPSLKGGRIEDMLTSDDRALIASKLGMSKEPSKSQIQLFFSELLARKERLSFSGEFVERITAFEQAINDRVLASSSPLEVA